MARWELARIPRPSAYSVWMQALLIVFLFFSTFASSRPPPPDGPFTRHASRFGRRLPSRRGALSWMRLFGDMRLTELALPATLHSTLTDVNDPRYYEIAHAQNVGVSQQLRDGIRVLDVRPWRSQEYGGWYSEVPWRIEEDMVNLRKGAHLPSSSSGNPPEKTEGNPNKSGAQKQDATSPSTSTSSSTTSASSPVSQSSGKRTGTSPTPPTSLIDIHSETNLEESLFRPVQRFLRTNMNEVVVVVFSALNGNRHGSMNSVKHASSLGTSLKHYLEYMQPGGGGGEGGGQQQKSEGGGGNVQGANETKKEKTRNNGDNQTTSSSSFPRPFQGSPKYVEGHPGVGEAGPSVKANLPSNEKISNEGDVKRGDEEKDAKNGEETLPYEVLSEDEVYASFLSSAVRKPLLYEEVYELMELIDRYWGALLPRHDHVFVGRRTTSTTTTPRTTIPSGVSTPQNKGNEGKGDISPSTSSPTPIAIEGSTAFPTGHPLPYSRTLDSTRSSSAYDVYPMAESVHLPEVFASWLQRQGEMWLSEIPLREIISSRVQLLLFVDDPLVAWFITAFSKEHVMAFVAGDHIYDVSYKSEALFAPCGIPNRSGPIGDELSSTKVSTWMECRAACEALSGEKKTSANTAQKSSSSSPSQPSVVPLRGPCTHWTFGPVTSPSSSSSSSSFSSSSAYTTYEPPPGVSDCRTFAGSYTLASLSVVPGTVTETIKCPARTLLDDARQWSAASIFEDLTDSICPLIGPGISAKAMRTSRPFARELCLLDLSGTYGLSTSSRRQEQRLLSSSSYDEGGNNSFSSSPLSSLPRGLQVSKKLIRVYFAPSSPLFFIDGIRRGQRYLGPADLTAGMNRLTIPWVQWHLDRQAFLENNLSAMNILRADKQAASTVTAFFSPSTPASSRGERGGYGDGSPSRSLSAVQNGPVTRPVNALMVMRYDNLDGKASYDRGVGPGWRGPGDVYPPRRTLNYFEIIMHLNPLPPSAAAALAMESELGDFSAEHYIRLTALRDPDDLDENFLVAFLSGKSRRSSDGGGDSTPTPMIWLVACVAVLCLWAMLSAFFCSSTICWKRARIDGRRGPWAVGPAVSGPGGVVGAGSVIEAP